MCSRMPCSIFQEKKTHVKFVFMFNDIFQANRYEQTRYLLVKKFLSHLVGETGRCACLPGSWMKQVCAVRHAQLSRVLRHHVGRARHVHLRGVVGGSRWEKKNRFIHEMCKSRSRLLFGQLYECDLGVWGEQIKPMLITALCLCHSLCPCGFIVLGLSTLLAFLGFSWKDLDKSVVFFFSSIHPLPTLMNSDFYEKNPVMSAAFHYLK